MLHDFWFNFTHNLFKPLLLFFYMGFAVPLLKVPFEFPHVLYQSLTIYLLIAIGWHGGEELASLSSAEFVHAGGFMILGFLVNSVIGFAAYAYLRKGTRLRQIDAATVAGYYGSDSAGTFVTCLGVLTGANILYAAYMPVMLAVMEIPGCLVALFIVSRLRNSGKMDPLGNMPGEPGYTLALESNTGSWSSADDDSHENNGHSASVRETVGAARSAGAAVGPVHAPTQGFLSPKVLHEVFLNPGLYLLFGGILIGFVGRLQGANITAPDDPVFITLFQGALCLFLLEMGMTACKRLRDLRTAGWPFIFFGVIAPNVFATFGMFVAHGYSKFLGQPFDIGTYALFAVLCGAASYIAVPAIQRLAIPESSPTLPLAASLGLTFSYNVTVGIPIYIEIAKAITKTWPVA